MNKSAIIYLKCIKNKHVKRFEIELFTNQTSSTYKYIRRFRYYEFFEEKISRRNVTYSVATCCHGYEKVNGKCLSE